MGVDGGSLEFRNRGMTMDSKREVTATEVMEELRRHETSCKEHRKTIDQRFDGVDQRFDGVNQRFDGIDKRLDGIDKRLDKTDDRIEKGNENIKFWIIMSTAVLSFIIVTVSTFMSLSNSHSTVVYAHPPVIEQPTTPAPN